MTYDAILVMFQCKAAAISIYISMVQGILQVLAEG